MSVCKGCGKKKRYKGQFYLHSFTSDLIKISNTHFSNFYIIIGVGGNPLDPISGSCIIKKKILINHFSKSIKFSKTIKFLQVNELFCKSLQFLQVHSIFDWIFRRFERRNEVHLHPLPDLTDWHQRNNPSMHCGDQSLIKLVQTCSNLI